MRKHPAFVPFLIAAGLHLLIGIALILGASFSLPKDKPKKEVAIINATVISQKQFDDLANLKDAKRAAAQRKIDQIRAKKEKVKREKALAEKQKIEKKKRKEAELKKQETLKKEQALKRKKEVERVKAEKLIAAAAVAKKKKELQAKKVADAKRKKKVEQERQQLKKIAAEKARADAKRKKDKQLKEKRLKDKKRKEAKARKAKLEKERKAADAARKKQAELDSLMAAEFDEEFSSAQSSKEQSEIARYQALIRDKISRNWQVEPSMKGKTCTLAIRLAADGLVLTVTRSSGNKELCASAERATLKVKKLPIPKDPNISSKFRDFDITLSPEF